MGTDGDGEILIISKRESVGNNSTFGRFIDNEIIIANNTNNNACA